jgi:release factor glutamine methyltransferase
MNPTIGWILTQTTLFFKKHSLESARLEAELLLSHVLGLDRLRLYTDHDRPLNSGEINKYKEVISQRLSGKPLAYITGEKQFLNWDFYVTPDVLVPRPETEILIEMVLEFTKDWDEGQILDLGTGSGVVALSLAHYLPTYQIDAVDISPAAIGVAKENAMRQQLNERVAFYSGDLFAALPVEKQGSYTGIVSNPPYIPSEVIPSLSKEVRAEPHTALDGGMKGMEIINRIIESAGKYLIPGGFLALEHGYDQFSLIKEAATKAGFSKVYSYKDYSNLPRVAICQ